MSRLAVTGSFVRFHTTRTNVARMRQIISTILTIFHFLRNIVIQNMSDKLTLETMSTLLRIMVVSEPEKYVARLIQATTARIRNVAGLGSILSGSPSFFKDPMMRSVGATQSAKLPNRFRSVFRNYLFVRGLDEELNSMNLRLMSMTQ